MTKKEEKIQAALGIKRRWVIYDINDNYNIDTVDAPTKEEALEIVRQAMKNQGYSDQEIATVSVKIHAPKDPTDNFLRYLKKQIDKGKKKDKK